MNENSRDKEKTSLFSFVSNYLLYSDPSNPFFLQIRPYLLFSHLLLQLYSNTFKLSLFKSVPTLFL